MDKFKDTAVECAKEAAKIHRKYFGKNFIVSKKGSSFDLVTTADLEAEKKIVSIIKNKFPQHNILAEEYKYANTDSEYRWVIDPLDGTNNFAFGVPIFCVSVALVKKEEVILGVIYDTTRDELFFAEKGKGAFLNDAKIKVSPVLTLTGSLLITGFYYDRGANMVNNLDTIRKFFQEKVVGIRRFGSAALDLCYIACGRATGFWEFKLSPWDFAAGVLIVEEAGGKVTDKSGNRIRLENSFVVATNSHIHQDVLRIINQF